MTPVEYDDLRGAVANICRAAGVPDPAAWLATVMTGRDPRPMDAPLVDMVRKIAYRAFDDDPGADDMPTPDEWEAIVQHVLGSGLYEAARVPLRDSQAAATQLMQYLHSRRQELRAAVTATTVTTGPPPPLTDDEIKSFRKLFNDVF